MTPTQPSHEQLADLAELVSTGPVDLGAYTQAELAVVLGQVQPLAGVDSDAVAEAVRSLAARGVLFREVGSDSVDVVGDLGLVVSLVGMQTGSFEVRRGHDGPADEPWRWLISLLPSGMAGIDRIDALGLHRLSVISLDGLADEVSERLLGGPAQVPQDAEQPIAVTDEELRRVTQKASERWQVIYRGTLLDGSRMMTDALVLRTGERRVDLVTRAPDGPGYQRFAVDEASLKAFLLALATN